MKGGLVLASSLLLVFHMAWGCPEVCTCQPSSRTVDCSYRRLLEIPSHLPSQTQVLYLQGNQIRIINHTSFMNVPGLQILDLSNNSISRVPPYAFHYLRSLQLLNLTNNFIQYLDGQVFTPLLALKKLDLSSNNMSTLPESLGNNTRNLTFLGLKNNHLQAVDRMVLETLINLKVLLAKANPWQCSCPVVGLKLWLENFLYTGGIIDELICTGPEDRKGKDLLKIPFELYKSCPPFTTSFPVTNIHQHSLDHRNNGRHGHHGEHIEGTLPECEPKPKPRPANLRHAIATVVITGVVCGIVCLMMLAAAVYGCAYAAIMAKYHKELKEVERMASASEHGSPEEKEPLDGSLA
ncbi:leucine-rich repeat and transmembrane domain-containing protein 1 isoform X2 [Hyla sarda]|uniref:leucine-rich repeat and transmembrane domain-containing protein 1 isoform X2 n=1 Tax=Hyla sarda TaxID=327740 RepID=UPI0024C3DBA2|nr:leucine-rich repeat and transmembrane domain-containing protein 1 isoform X2 [Hyla sarda]